MYSMRVYACLQMDFVQAQRVFNSSVCGCVFTQTDAVWWSECQHCSRLPITVCYLSGLLFFCCLFVPDCWVTDVFNHLSVSVFLCRDCQTFHPIYMRIQSTSDTNSLTVILKHLADACLSERIIDSFQDMSHSQKWTNCGLLQTAV